MERTSGSETGRQYVWHGVTWATGKPTLLLANTATGLLDQIEVMGLELGLKVSNPARFCTGRYGFADTFHVEPVPCPWQAEAGNGGQCPKCLEQDEFRFAHQFHKGGHAPPTLAAYMSQPHWLYIATFAHGASKVGTAAAPRRTSRLDEQGAMLATYLAEAPDGRVVCYLEDAISREIGVSQVVRGAAKLAALADPDPSRVQTAHERVVESVVAVLAALEVSSAREEWSSPAEGLALRSPQLHGDRAVYPHDLREGEHGFHIESCAGTQILARLSAGAEAVRYVLDLNALKGRRIVLGDFHSPETTFQGALF
ncbi:MAG: hypothetical protein ACRDSR_21385 [Pseudonocardiaceae bacterium]